MTRISARSSRPILEHLQHHRRAIEQSVSRGRDDAGQFVVHADRRDHQRHAIVDAAHAVLFAERDLHRSDPAVEYGGGLFRLYLQRGGGNSYDGGLSCPLPVPSPPFTYSTLPTSTRSPGTVAGGRVGQGLLPKQANGTYPLAGPPCAFACHSDNSVLAGQGQDFYGLARSTIGTANPITLRFDLLKQATNELLGTMSTANTISGNLSVGVFSFNNTLTQVYPTTGEAGSTSPPRPPAVGAAPTVANGPDTGIQPDAFVTNSVHADTDFPDTMATLSTTVTASGNGATPSAPRKVLILITDGYENYNNGNVTGAFDVSACTTFKNMGYTVYVVYTPYQPLMWLVLYQSAVRRRRNWLRQPELQSPAVCQQFERLHHGQRWPEPVSGFTGVPEIGDGRTGPRGQLTSHGRARWHGSVKNLPVVRRHHVRCLASCSWQGQDF